MKNNRTRGRPATPETQIQEGWLNGARKRFLIHGFAHGSPALKDLLARCKKLASGNALKSYLIEDVAREWATAPSNWPSGCRPEGTWIEKFAAQALRACEQGWPAEEKGLMLIPEDVDADSQPLPAYTFSFADRHWTPRFKIRIIRGPTRAGNEIYYEPLHSLDEFAAKLRSEFNDELNDFLETTRSQESARLTPVISTKLPTTWEEDLELAARYYLCDVAVEKLMRFKDPSAIRKRIGRILTLLGLALREPGRPRKKPRK